MLKSLSTCIRKDCGRRRRGRKVPDPDLTEACECLDSSICVYENRNCFVHGAVARAPSLRIRKLRPKKSGVRGVSIVVSCVVSCLALFIGLPVPSVGQTASPSAGVSQAKKIELPEGDGKALATEYCQD